MIAEPDARPVDDLRSFLAALWHPGDVREVRIPRHDGRRTAAGWFDDPRLLAAAVASWDGRANLYVTLNPVDPALLARAANRIDPSAKATTTDANIVARRWLLVDVDPRRPAGISATDEESAAAREVAREVRRYLSGLGWPWPIVAMTGNGHALLYRIDLPNVDASTTLVAGVLRHLAERFDDDRVTIDTSVSNAARIGALVGTMKVKGDATPARPHRRSGIVVMPEGLDVVPDELLAALVPLQAALPPLPPSSSSLPAGWVLEWLDRAGIAYHHERVDARGTTWYNLDDCPFHPGEDVGGNCGVGEAADGHATGRCQHNRGTGKGWKDFRTVLGLGLAPAFTFTEAAVPAAPAPVEPEAGSWPALPEAPAYHGVLGDIALAVAPLTEADPVGVLGTLLAMFGAACGGGRAIYQGSLQRTNLSVLLVGETGFRGRKGTALDLSRSVFRLAYPHLEALWLVGVASGEAITGHLAREIDGRPRWATDERVLIVEPEFGRLLTIMNREGSTLSAVLRNAWDGVPLGHARARDETLVTRHHVTMLGHVTPVELRAKLTDADAANGFANRLLFLAVRRARVIAFPTAPDEIVRPWVEKLHRAIVEARTPGELAFDEAAKGRWEDFYADLAVTPRLGLAGAVTGRHEAQVARLALIYALADRTPAIGAAHLDAAIALADYARRSATWALGDSTGNRHADVLRRMLVDGEIGWKEAKVALGLRTAADMADAVAVLVDAGLAEVVRVQREGPAGRPRQVIRGSAKGAKGAKDAGGARR